MHRLISGLAALGAAGVCLLAASGAQGRPKCGAHAERFILVPVSVVANGEPLVQVAEDRWRSDAGVDVRFVVDLVEAVEDGQPFTATSCGRDAMHVLASMVDPLTQTYGEWRLEARR